MTFITPAGVEPAILKNVGKQWIQHGDNVITLSNVQSSTSFIGSVTIQIANMGGVTTRGPYHNTNPMTPTVQVGTVSRLLVRLHGGYGFTSCGYIAAATGTTERFDDIANTQTARTVATPRYGLAGYSLNGFGFTSGGSGPLGTTERFDDVANTQTARTTATARTSPAGYSLNGFGFTSCGQDAVPAVVGTTERFDDVANSWTGRSNAVARRSAASYGLNNYGFTSCGCNNVAGNCVGGLVGPTERFDDIANTQTGRTDATARYNLSGYSLSGYGFTSGGYIADVTDITERFDDVANTQTGKTSLTTARQGLAEYSLNGFGFTSCGYDVTPANVGTTERFDDVANTQTARTAATTRNGLAGYSTNEYFINYVTMD